MNKTYFLALLSLLLFINCRGANPPQHSLSNHTSAIDVALTEPSSSEPLISHEALMELLVEHPDSSFKTINRIFGQNNGLLISRNNYQFSYRIPSASFSKTLEDLAGIGKVKQRLIEIITSLIDPLIEVTTTLDQETTHHQELGVPEETEV